MKIIGQTSFGIPAEGVYTGLVLMLIVVIALLIVAVVWLMRQNNRLAQDSIRGFRDINAALNALREDLGTGDSNLTKHLTDTERRINENLEKIQSNVTEHLRFIRDRLL